MCFKDISSFRFASIFCDEVTLCSKCALEMKGDFRSFKLNGFRAYYLYDYEESIRNHLFLLKGCGDLEIAKIFFSSQIPLLKVMFWGYFIVPAPSFEERNQQRGFNQVEAIFAPLGLPFLNVIRKIDDVKQADCSKEERNKIGDHLRLENGVSLKGKKILFVDDVYTTGATAKACIRLISQAQPKTIRALFMAKVKPVNEEKNSVSKNP